MTTFTTFCDHGERPLECPRCRAERLRFELGDGPEAAAAATIDPCPHGFRDAVLCTECHVATNGTVDEHGLSEPLSIVSDTQHVLSAPSNPMAVAREFVSSHYSEPAGAELLRHWRGNLYAYEGTCWPDVEDRRVRAELYRFLDRAVYEKGDRLVAWEPTSSKVRNVVDAMQSLVHIDAATTSPAWLGEQQEPAHDYVAMRNGLLHLPTRAMIEHTPEFFSQHALPFDHDPDAPEPARWLKFLRELWPDDPSSISVLAEVMGYVIAGGTGQHKLFLAVGPKRSGKGTIGRVLGGLLGIHNVAAPTLSSLSTNFGLSPLIGKPLAVISDARLTRINGLVAVERLLSISGEDAITIDRKYREPWTGCLPTRFLILTNEIPRFDDSSGALPSRFVVLVMTNSFYGSEDPLLTEKLLEESSGILNWCLQGLDRLQARGHFVQPASANEALRQLEDLTSPVGAFVRDRCTIGAGLEAAKDELYGEWRDWCEAEGWSRPSSKSVFCRDLRAAFPLIRERRPRDGSERHRAFVGVGLGKTVTETLDHPGPSASPASPARQSGLWAAGPENHNTDEVVQGGPGDSGSHSQDCPECGFSRGTHSHTCRLLKDDES